MLYMPTGPQPVKPTNKPLATETADIPSLRRARVGGNSHHNGRRRRRPQIRDGVRQAALQADTAVLLVRQHGFSIADAARRTRSNHTAIEAMGILHDNGDIKLLIAVLAGEMPFLPTAARIKPVVKAMKAFNALSNTDRVEFARREGPEKLSNEVIVPASAPVPVHLVVET